MLVHVMPKHSTHILELAKRGAAVRLQELLDEAKRLMVAFPHLRDAFDKDELPIKFIVRRGATQVPSNSLPSRRRMSAAARKAVSAKMKKQM